MMPIWERRHTADPTDRRQYKGGDGGAKDMRRMEEERQAKVQSAVDAINAKFGIKSGTGAPAPTREGFTRRVAVAPGSTTEAPLYGLSSGGHVGHAEADSGTAGGGGTVMSDVFDEDGYNKALADHEAKSKGAGDAAAVREALYADIQGAVKDTAMRGLDRQFTDASKRNTFGLARSGLLGGSVDAEAGGELTELYGEGRLKAAQAGQQAASDLRVTDEKTRQNLIGLAQSGLDTGTAASMAAGQMGAAADLARSQTASADVGRLFDDMGQAYLMNQSLKGRGQVAAPQPGSTGYGSNLWGARGYSGTTQK